MAAQRKRMLVLPLDSDYAVPAAAAAARALLESVDAAGAGGDVGLGVLSMLGFDSTCEHMEARACRCTLGPLRAAV